MEIIEIITEDLVEKNEKSNGGDVRKVEMNGLEFLGKGGDRR